jgi:hypothetical protein
VTPEPAPIVEEVKQAPASSAPNPSIKKKK